MRKIIAAALSIAIALSFAAGLVPTVSADVIQGKRYTYEIETLDADRISYDEAAGKDFYNYGNGVSGTYIRVQHNLSGQSGGGVVGNYVEFTLNVPEAGSYTVSYAYRLHTTSGTNQLSVNGTDTGVPRDFNDRSFGKENDMVRFTTDPLTLPAGDNVIKLTTTKLSATNQDRITVDYVEITSADRTTVGYENVVFVSHIPYFDMQRSVFPDHVGSTLTRTSPGTLTFDKCSCGARPIILGGTEYTKGFGLNPYNGTTSVLTIPLPEGAVAFKCAVGINDHINGDESYDQKNVVSFFVDGNPVYQTQPLAFNHIENIDIPLPYGAKTLTIQNDCGVNNVNDHICFGDARFEIGTANDISLKNFSIADAKVLADGDNIYALLPEGANLTGLAPTFTLGDTSECDKPSGSAQDFTNPVIYTVTASNGDRAAYTVTIYTGNTLPAGEQTAMESVKEKIDAISSAVSMTDRAAAEEARLAFDQLSGKAKLLVSNYDKLTSAMEVIAAYLSDKVRVACVGDSITEGGVAMKAYPDRLQDILGDDFQVYNAGVGGTTLSKNGNYPYWITSAYQYSKEFEPDFVLIMLGTNDANSTNWGNCKDKFEGYYRELIAEYQNLDSKPTILLGTSAWFYRSSDADQQTAINTVIAPLVRSLGAEYGFTVVDINSVTANHAEWFTRDGVHPDDTGYEAVAEAFSEPLLKYSSADLREVKLGGETLADFTSGDKQTITASTAIHPEELEFDADGSVAVSVEEQPGKTEFTFTVTSENERYLKTYYLTVLDGSNPVLPGDVDGDGALDASDVVILRQLIRNGGATEDQIAAGDLNGDEALTDEDLSLLLEQLDILPGDADGSGVISPLDIMILRKALLDSRVTDELLAAADLDGSGTLGAADIMLLRKMILELG